MSAFESQAWLQHYTPSTPHTLDYGNVTLLDVYDNNLAINRNKPATWFFGRGMSYGELDEQVRGIAAGLRSLGVGPGDRVALILPNCPQHVAAFYAVLKLGAIVVEHNPLYTSHELREPFLNHGARVAIVWDKSAETVEKLRQDREIALETIISVNMIEAMPKFKQWALRIPLPKIRETRKQLTAPAPNTVPFSVLADGSMGGSARDFTPADGVDKNTPALLLYTSGTTGSPKGAQLTHGNLYANILQGKHWVPGLGDQHERLLGALPMFHAYGLTFFGTLGPFLGAEMVLLPSPQIPLLMDIMKKHPPTWIPGVPPLYEKIIEAAQDKGIDLSKIRNAFSGASTLPVHTVENWERATSGLLVEGYGLTECSPILVGNPMSEDRRPGYIGVPFPDTQVRIANPDNLDETLPDGQEGELLARGPQVFHGYYDNPEATEAAFHDGWFRTGDVGIMEKDGFIRLVSRIKEIIITGGFNVYPGEVEDTMLSHADVVECAVVGRPRSDGAEDVVACVVLRDGAELNPEGLRAFAKERLTPYKVPRTFYHFEDLAKDQLGKIRRREVQADLLKRLEDES